MLADKPDALATMLAVPTPVPTPAALLPVAVPLTPEVLRVSLLTKPETVCVKVGLAAPNKRLWLSALTVRGALAMVSVPLFRVVKS